eukprot:10932713-Lingulodinium_polyedra.AAC.1
MRRGLTALFTTAIGRRPVAARSGGGVWAAPGGSSRRSRRTGRGSWGSSAMGTARSTAISTPRSTSSGVA